MASRLPPLNALRAFEAAARHLSVKKAAIELNVTPAAVSHQIRTLEDYLGVQLFHRYNRALELTDAARASLPKLREGFDCLVQAVERLRSHVSGGVLTVSAAPSFAARWLMPRLHRFIVAHPEVDVRVSARMRRVSVDGKGDVAERATVEAWLDDSDIAILYGRGNYPGMWVKKLLDLTITPICSPQLLKGEHPLKDPRDLSHHMLLHDDTGDLYDNEPFWDVWLRAADVQGIDPRFCCFGSGCWRRPPAIRDPRRFERRRQAGPGTGAGRAIVRSSIGRLSRAATTPIAIVNTHIRL